MIPALCSLSVEPPLDVRLKVYMHDQAEKETEMTRFYRRIKEAEGRRIQEAEEERDRIRGD